MQCFALRQNFASGFGAAATFCSAFKLKSRLLPLPESILLPAASEEASRIYVGSKKRHRTARTGWLRAAVLGANDGILSTSSLVLGVAAAHATRNNLLVAGLAGLVAGAMSMAAGEYVSVHSQADTEYADLELERAELKADDKGEHKELMAIYVARGLDPALAKQVAEQLMAHDAIGAHARDELGIFVALRARPIQAALASAACFAVGAAMPLSVTAMAPASALIPLVSGTSLVFLALLGGLAARAGGAGVMMGAVRRGSVTVVKSQKSVFTSRCDRILFSFSVARRFFAPAQSNG